MLLNFLDTDLYERQGKALTNFCRTLPEETSGLAQELTKDPYDFAFTGITGRYNERLLKDKLLNNITQFLVELGTGFAYVGKEYRLQIGDTENFIDLLSLRLRKKGPLQARDHLRGRLGLQQQLLHARGDHRRHAGIHRAGAEHLQHVQGRGACHDHRHGGSLTDLG